MTTQTAIPRAKRGKSPAKAIVARVPESTESVSAEVKANPKAATKAGTAPKKATKSADTREKKPKLIRDSFTLPEADYAIFKELKQRCLTSGIEVKKSELLRVALIALAKLSDTDLNNAVTALPRIKTGRPTKK